MVPPMSPEIVPLATGALYVALGLSALWLVTKITDLSLKSIVHDTIEEFRQLLQAKINGKAANALGTILLFVLIVYLNFGGLGHIALPEKQAGTHIDLYRAAANVIYLFIFGGVLLLSLRLTKYMR